MNACQCVQFVVCLEFYHKDEPRTSDRYYTEQTTSAALSFLLMQAYCTYVIKLSSLPANTYGGSGRIETARETRLQCTSSVNPLRANPEHPRFLLPFFVNLCHVNSVPTSIFINRVCRGSCRIITGCVRTCGEAARTCECFLVTV